MEKGRPPGAPSRAASFRSAARWVGFPYRPYSLRSTRPSKWSAISWLSRNAYVAVWTIGAVSELARFSRGSPPCTDWVLGPGSRGGPAAARGAGGGAAGGGGGVGGRGGRHSRIPHPRLLP